MPRADSQERLSGIRAAQPPSRRQKLSWCPAFWGPLRSILSTAKMCTGPGSVLLRTLISSMKSPPPPVDGWEWHPVHVVPLNSGPSCGSSSISLKLICPVAKIARSVVARRRRATARRSRRGLWGSWDCGCVEARRLAGPANALGTVTRCKRANYRARCSKSGLSLHIRLLCPAATE